MIRTPGYENVPVVIIGNIVAGGSGKTPLLIALIEFLKSNGIKVGVVSRGYGGSNKGIKQLDFDDQANQVGDEPLMIFQRCTVPVVVATDRPLAVAHLLQNNDCDIVLSDDGMQHYAMDRDIEIAVIDAGRQFGNGFCIPAGPLRERVSRLKSVDLTVFNNVPAGSEPMYYQLQNTIIQSLYDDNELDLACFKGGLVHAVTGIGFPDRFFDQLKKQLDEYEIRLVTHAFADHHQYQQLDFDGFSNEIIIMTDKDAVKCQSLNLQNAWVYRVDVVMSSGLRRYLQTSLLPKLFPEKFTV